MFSRERIIEYCLDDPTGPLASLSARDFVLSVGARTPAPGGGSVAALVGALVRSHSSPFKANECTV